MQTPPATVVFVYNADSTFFAIANDFVKKIVAPEKQGCNLCKITYGPLSPKKEWKSFLATLPQEKVFLHRDEFQWLFPEKKDMLLPAIFIKANDILSPLVTAEEINRAKTITDLATLITDKIKSQSNE